MLKGLLRVVLYCVLVLAIAWVVTLVLSALPLPFVGILGTVVWVIAGIICLYVLGRYLIAMLPDDLP